MVNMAFPVSMPPEAVVNQPRTVSSPPVGNVSLALNAISTSELLAPATYETVKFLIGCGIARVPVLDFLLMMLSIW